MNPKSPKTNDHKEGFFGMTLGRKKKKESKFFISTLTKNYLHLFNLKSYLYTFYLLKTTEKVLLSN